MGVDPNVERMEVTDWLQRIEQEPRKTRCRFVYTKIFGHCLVQDFNYSYWCSFIRDNNIKLSTNVRYKRGIKAVDVETHMLRIGSGYVRKEMLSI